jgi:hypothetical protein
MENDENKDLARKSGFKMYNVFQRQSRENGEYCKLFYKFVLRK